MKIEIIFLFVFFANIFAAIDTDWWKYTTIYEIYIRSFKDSNGDGIGDIKGRYIFFFYGTHVSNLRIL